MYTFDSSHYNSKLMFIKHPIMRVKRQATDGDIMYAV